MRRHLFMALAATALAVLPAVGGAQGRGGDVSPQFEQRARVEQGLREAFARQVRERLALTDEQATRLQEVNRRFGDERMRILREEFRARRELRRSLAGRDSTLSPETARLLDELLAFQRQRLDVQQREQQALAEFLTPEQRARYLAMTDELRRRVQARVDSGRDARRRGPPY